MCEILCTKQLSAQINYLHRILAQAARQRAPARGSVNRAGAPGNKVRHPAALSNASGHVSSLSAAYDMQPIRAGALGPMQGGSVREKGWEATSLWVAPWPRARSSSPCKTSARLNTYYRPFYAGCASHSVGCDAGREAREAPYFQVHAGVAGDMDMQLGCGNRVVYLS